MKHDLRTSIGLLAATLLLGTVGCTKLANKVGWTSGETQLRGDNAAVGGVNDSLEGRSGNYDWDRHIDGCRYGADHQLIFTSGGKDVVRYTVDAATITAFTNDGDVTLPASACSVNRLERTDSNAQRMTGKLAVVCDANRHELNLGVRFQNCGQ